MPGSGHTAELRCPPEQHTAWHCRAAKIDRSTPNSCKTHSTSHARPRWRLLSVDNNCGDAPTAQHHRLLYLAVPAHWCLRDKTRCAIAGKERAGAQWGPISRHMHDSRHLSCRGSPLATFQPCRAPHSNTLMRVLHQSLDATARALLFVVSSRSLEFTAARRRERHIFLAGPQQGLPLGSRTPQYKDRGACEADFFLPHSKPADFTDSLGIRG